MKRLTHAGIAPKLSVLVEAVIDPCCYGFPFGIASAKKREISGRVEMVNEFADGFKRVRRYHILLLKHFFELVIIFSRESIIPFGFFDHNSTALSFSDASATGALHSLKNFFLLLG